MSTISPLRIQDLPEELRPREKLTKHGASSLNNAELIAIFLGTGVPGENAIQIGQRLLSNHGNLHDLAKLDVTQITAEHGLGPAKACQLAAAFEIGSRLAEQRMTRCPLRSPEDVYRLMAPKLQHLRVESLQVILTDTRLKCMRSQEITRGSVNETICHPRDILQPAIAHQAHGIFIVHNHPSGDPTPSQADKIITKRIRQACELMQIKFHDHVIIGYPGSDTPYYSFQENE